MGFVSEDGTITGSIDVNQLDEVEPKTDEAKAQIDALKAQIREGQEAADKAAEESTERVEAQAAPTPEGEGTTTEASPPTDAPSSQPAPSEQPQPEGQPAQPEGQPQPEQSAAAGRRGRNQPQGG